MTLHVLFALWIAQAPQAPQAASPKAPEAEAGAPASESWLTGTIEIGQRWRSDVRGSQDAYRSVVDLGSGLKMLTSSFILTDPTRRVFDSITVDAQNWGDDPYTTLRIRARKQGVYDFSGDHRNFAYFNALPSFANPLAGTGGLLNQRSFDLRRRLDHYQLDLMPGRSLIPYFAYERQEGTGRGVDVFVENANEYAVPTLIKDGLNGYRGGARLELGRLHGTFEHGVTSFGDSQFLGPPQTRNAGNRSGPYFGQALFLNSLTRSYAIYGSSRYSKALLSGSPTRWADFSASLLHSTPETTTALNQTATGNFAISPVIFATTQQLFLASQARLPHTAATLAGEVRPLKRIRLLGSWLTDRLDNAGFLSAAVPVNSRLRNVYSQADADVIAVVTRYLTLRGGYRATWGDAILSTVPGSALFVAPSGTLRRTAGKGGFQFTPGEKLRINADFEGASSSQVYFRTSLNEYFRARIRARYQLLTSLSVSADVALLDNQNPAPHVRWESRSRQTTASIFWTPKGERISLQGSYSRSAFSSDIGYIAPQYFERERSLYRDNAHTFDALLELAPRKVNGPRFTIGGTGFLSSGSRPTRHYQPLLRAQVPAGRGVTFFSEWRYHGFSEPFYVYEGFRAHLITSGIRFSR